MPQWYDITRQEGYQNLPPEDRSSIKQMFFERYVSPEIDNHPELKGDADAKKAAFYKFMELPDDTGQGQITSGIASAARGFGEIIPGAIQGAGALTGITPLEDAGSTIREGLEYVTPVNPIYEDTVLNKGAGVVGQIGSVLATGGVGGAIGKGLAAERIVAGATAAEQALAASQAIGRGANAALYGSAALQGAAGGAQSADQYGLTGAARYGNILAGAAGEVLSEKLPFGLGAETAAAKRLLGAAPQIGRALGAIGSEAGEEGANQIWQNAALGALAPTGTETPGLLDGALEAAGYGALGGGILAGVNVATGAYKTTPVQAADELIVAADATGEAPMATAAAAQTNNVSAAVNAENDLTRYMPPTDLDSGLYDASQADLTADALAGLQPLPNEQPIDPATGIPVPQDGAGQAEILEPVIDTGNLGGAVLPTEQPEEVGQAPQAEVASLAEGVERNRAMIEQAAAINAGTAQGPNLNFPQVQPSSERRYTVANVKTGKVVSRPDEPMTHKEAVTFRSKFSQPNNFTLVDVTNEQVSPSGAAPTGIATTTGQPMPGGSGAAVDMVPLPGVLPGGDTAIPMAPRKPYEKAIARLKNQVGENVSLIDMQRIHSAVADGNSPEAAGDFAYREKLAHYMAKDAVDKALKAGLIESGKPAQDLYEQVYEQFAPQPLSPAATTQETPSSPAAKLEKEGAVPGTSAETEVGGRSNIPVGTKVNADAEASSGKGVSLLAQKEEVKPLPKEIKAVHFSRSPLSLSEQETGSSVGEGSESVFGFGLYAMEPQDQKGWESMDRLVLGKNRNELTIKAKTPLIVSPETIVGLMQQASKDGVTFNNPWGFHSWLRKQAEKGKNDALVVRGFDLSGEKSRVISEKIEARLRELWSPVFPKGKTDGKFINGSELKAAVDKATMEITGLSPQELEVAGSMQNQIFIPPNKVGIVDGISLSDNGKVEAGNSALDDIISKLPPVAQAKYTPEVRAKAAKFFESKNEADLSGLTTIQKTKVHDALYRADKEAADAQKAADKLYEKRLREAEKENARLEKERANQVKLTESRRKAYDSIIGTPTSVEMGAVSPADGQEALAAVHNTGDVPGVLNAFVGTSSDFIANAENEKNFPALWQLLQTGRVDEGNFVYGRAFVFTDGIGINRMDRENAVRYGTTPAVAAVRRVLVHESLVHRGIFGLPANLQARIIQWVMQNTSPEQLDSLARDYPQYENWRGDEFQMMALAEEYLAKTVESLNGMPKIGPIAHLVEILRDIWRWMTGRSDEPTIQNLRDVVKLLKAGAQAADARLVNGGKVDIRESKPAFANPLNAQLANAAERMRKMRETQEPQAPDAQQIRNEIRAAYDRALVGQGSIQVSLQRVFDEVKAQMPELTERQFGEQVQALYEDGSAFLVPTDRGADMLADGEKWGVYDVAGQPSSYLGIMPVDIKASRITEDPRSQLPKDVKQQAKVVSKLGPDALNSHRALKTLRESQPKFHAKQESEPLIDVAVNIVESLEKNGVLPEELNDYLLDSDFLDELGIKMNDSLYQAITVEVYRTQLEKADELENEGDIAGANRMRERVIATHNQWFKSGTDAGQRLNFRQALMLNPRYQGLFLLSHLNEMLSENAEKTVKSQTEIKAEDVAKKAEEAATQATEQTAEDIVDAWLEAAEETLSVKAKGLLATFREIMDEIAYLLSLDSDVKQSVSGNRAARLAALADKYRGVTKEDRAKTIAKLRKKAEDALSSLTDEITGKTAPAETKEKVKSKVKKAVEDQAKKGPRKKLTTEEKAKKKQERADAVAQRLIYRTQEVFRQGFKNESKQNNADSILKAFRDQVATPVSDAAFIERVAKLNVTEAVAQRMLNTAERERTDHQRMERNAILDSEESLKKLMHKLSKKLGVFQIDPTSWRKLFSTSTASQSQRRQEMEAAIKADPAFQNLDADDQQLLADLVDEAWEAQRKKVFESEIARLTRTKRTSDAGAKAVEGETEKLLQLVNQGLLTNDSFYKAVAEKFGFKDITQEQKNRLQKIAQDLQKDDLPPHRRTMLAEEFKDIVSDVAHVPFAQIAADTWVTSVLTGWRTAVTIALAAESGGYQVISTALAEIVKNTGDLNAWKTAGTAINAWISSMPRNARNALGYLWDGKADRLDPTMANLAAYMDLDKKELSRVNTANALLKSKNVFSRLLGHYLHFFQKFLTALDMFNAASAKQGSLPIAYYQTRKSQDKPFDVKEFATLKDFKAARQHILNTEFDGKEPTGFLEKGRLDAWANQYMWQQIGKFEGILENANYNAQQGAMTLDPAGVGGMLYHAILSVQASQKKRAEEFMQQAKEASLQAETWQEKLTANNKMALAYLYQFAAYNLTSMVGLKFARYAGNRLNQTISFIPGIGLARLNEKKGVPQEMHSAQIIANQAVGLLLLFTSHAILKAIADEPDEEKRGFGLSGSWDSLPPDKKSQLMSSGKQPYTITIGGKVFKYNNFPMGGVIAAIGSLADLVQYQPDKWNDKTLPGKLGSGFTAAMLSVSDSASLSQFSEMFGRSVQTRDPLDATINTLSKTAAGWAGGFIPRLLKDVDAMFLPAINRYKTPFEFMARELPVYRRSVGTPLLDIFAEPVAPSRGPLSREFIAQPTEPEYRLIGDLNEHGVFLTPANPENRLVGKGKNKRHMTDEEGLRYITLSGKGYRELVLRDARKILAMPRAKARQYVLDKADAIRDRSAKQAVRRT